MLTSRYASSAMAELFSDQKRAQVWRHLWILLAEEEAKLGLPISPRQIQALKRAQRVIDFDEIRAIEVELKHDVMSHLKAYGRQAPEAEGILHLGATSAFITDNADIVLFKEGLALVGSKVLEILRTMAPLMIEFKSLEMSGYTHFQPAQPVTLGKRLALWAQDLLWDLEEIDHTMSRLVPLGCKGTTGTQASFMTLFKGRADKVEALDRAIARRLGFKESVALSGQTLSRKVDTWILNVLSNLASTFSKWSYDARLLQHLREVMEGFGEKQIGSSAMAYKQNPMLAERITGISRFLMNLCHNGPWTHGTQWLERSLDDSSNRRLVMPEAFLSADALCEAALRWLQGMRVDKKLIAQNLERYSHFFVTENEMMEGALEGQSRQDLHESIRQKMVAGSLKKRAAPRELSGLASRQVERFVASHVKPALQKSWPHFKKQKFNSAGV